MWYMLNIVVDVERLKKQTLSAISAIAHSTW